jgi:hypothetical protein
VEFTFRTLGQLASLRRNTPSSRPLVERTFTPDDLDDDAQQLPTDDPLARIDRIIGVDRRTRKPAAPMPPPIETPPKPAAAPVPAAARRPTTIDPFAEVDAYLRSTDPNHGTADPRDIDLPAERSLGPSRVEEGAPKQRLTKIDPFAEVDAYLVSTEPNRGTADPRDVNLPAEHEDEPAFRAWYATQAKRHNLNPDPDAKDQHYDYRAAFRAGAEPDASGHWPSTFKADDHPNVVVGGFNTKTGERVHGTPRASEQELIKLGWAPEDAKRLTQQADAQEGLMPPTPALARGQQARALQDRYLTESTQHRTAYDALTRQIEPLSTKVDALRKDLATRTQAFAPVRTEFQSLADAYTAKRQAFDAAGRPESDRPALLALQQELNARVPALNAQQQALGHLTEAYNGMLGQLNALKTQRNGIADQVRTLTDRTNTGLSALDPATLDDVGPTATLARIGAKEAQIPSLIPGRPVQAQVPGITTPDHAPSQPSDRPTTGYYERIDPRTGRTMRLPVSSPIVEGIGGAITGTFDAASGALKAVPAAIGETIAGQNLPGHEQEVGPSPGSMTPGFGGAALARLLPQPLVELGQRLYAHAQMILSGQGGAVEPIGAIGAAVNPPDSVSMPASDEDAIHRAELGQPQARPRGTGEQVTLEVARRGMDMLAQIATDPAAVGAGAIEGPAAKVLAAAFTANGISTAAKVAADPKSTPADVATAMLGVAINALPLAPHVLRGSANAADAATASVAEQMRAALLATKLKAPTFSEGVQRSTHAGIHAPASAMEVIGGLEHTDVGESLGEAVRTARAPEPPPINYNQGRDRGVPLPRPDEGTPPPTGPEGPAGQAPGDLAPPYQRSSLPATVQDALRRAGHPDEAIAGMTPEQADQALATFTPVTPRVPSELGANATTPSTYAGPDRRGADRVSSAEEDARYAAARAERERMANGFTQTSPAAKENGKLRAEHEAARAATTDVPRGEAGIAALLDAHEAAGLGDDTGLSAVKQYRDQADKAGEPIVVYQLPHTPGELRANLHLTSAPERDAAQMPAEATPIAVIEPRQPKGAPPASKPVTSLVTASEKPWAEMSDEEQAAALMADLDAERGEISQKSDSAAKPHQESADSEPLTPEGVAEAIHHGVRGATDEELDYAIQHDVDGMSIAAQAEKDRRDRLTRTDEQMRDDDHLSLQKMQAQLEVEHATTPEARAAAEQTLREIDAEDTKRGLRWHPQSRYQEDEEGLVDPAETLKLSKEEQQGSLQQIAKLRAAIADPANRAKGTKKEQQQIDRWTKELEAEQDRYEGTYHELSRNLMGFDADAFRKQVEDGFTPATPAGGTPSVEGVDLDALRAEVEDAAPRRHEQGDWKVGDTARFKSKNRWVTGEIREFVDTKRGRRAFMRFDNPGHGKAGDQFGPQVEQFVDVGELQQPDAAAASRAATSQPTASVAEIELPTGGESFTEYAERIGAKPGTPAYDKAAHVFRVTFEQIRTQRASPPKPGRTDRDGRVTGAVSHVADDVPSSPESAVGDSAPTTNSTTPTRRGGLGEPEGSEAPAKSPTPHSGVSPSVASTAARVKSDRPTAYSKAAIKKAFNLTAAQAEAVGALVDAMGLDTSQIFVAMGGTPSAGALLSGDLDPRVVEGLRTLRETLRYAGGAKMARIQAQSFLNTPIENIETGLVATVSRESLDKMLSKSNVDRSVSPRAHMTAVANLDALFRLATQEDEHASRTPEVVAAIRIFDAPLPLEGEVLRARMLTKVFRRQTDGARLYFVEAVEIGAVGDSAPTTNSTTPTRRAVLGEPEGSEAPAGAPRPHSGVSETFARMVAIVKGEPDTLYQLPPALRALVTKLARLPRQWSNYVTARDSERVALRPDIVEHFTDEDLQDWIKFTNVWRDPRTLDDLKQQYEHWHYMQVKIENDLQVLDDEVRRRKYGMSPDTKDRLLNPDKYTGTDTLYQELSARSAAGKQGAPVSLRPDPEHSPDRLSLSRSLTRLGQRVLDASLAVKDDASADDPLYQGPKGAAEFAEDGKAIVRGLEKADVSTAVHELFHVARRQRLNRTVPIEQRGGITDEDLDEFEAWAGADEGWTRDAEEKAARGFERYLHDGSAPTSRLAALFKKLAAWLKTIYQTLTGSDIDIEIPAAIRAIFDSLVTTRDRVEAAASSRPAASHPVGQDRAIDKTGVFAAGSRRAARP